MNFNKKIVKTMIFALGIGGISLFGVREAKASAVGTPALNPDTGLITAENATKWVPVKTVKKEKGSDFSLDSKFYKIVGNLEDYSEGVYGPALGMSKDVIVAFGKSDKIPKNGDGWKVIKIGAEDKYFKVGYIAKGTEKFNKVAKDNTNSIGTDETGYLIFTDGKKPVGFNVEENKEKVHVKIGNGNWGTIKNILGDSAEARGKILTRLVQKGANLSFKKLPVSNNPVWGSKEVSVKVPGLSNSPSVKADLKKDEFSTKKGMSYRIVSIDGSEPNTKTWQTITTTDAKKKLTFKDIVDGDNRLEAKDKNWVIEFRNDATAKKIASLPVKLVLNKQEKVEKITEAFNMENGKLDKVGKILLTPILKYDVAKSGLILENKDTVNDYEYYIDHTKTSPFTTDVKWVRLPKAKSADKPTKAKIKHSSEVKMNTFGAGKQGTIHIRKVGQHQDKNNIVILPSAKESIDFTISNVVQELTLNGKKKDVPNELTLSPLSASTHRLAVALTNRQGENAKIKIKKDSNLRGVKFIFPKNFEGSTAVHVEIEIDEKAFTEEMLNGTGTKVSLTISTEGVSEEVFPIVFKKTS